MINTARCDEQCYDSIAMCLTHSRAAVAWPIINNRESIAGRLHQSMTPRLLDSAILRAQACDRFNEQRWHRFAYLRNRSIAISHSMHGAKACLRSSVSFGMVDDSTRNSFLICLHWFLLIAAQPCRDHCWFVFLHCPSPCAARRIFTPHRNCVTLLTAVCIVLRNRLNLSYLGAFASRGHGQR